jgi:hypothetical protein
MTYASAEEMQFYCFRWVAEGTNVMYLFETTVLIAVILTFLLQTNEKTCKRKHLPSGLIHSC